jgi:hypothetical protein
MAIIPVNYLETDMSTRVLHITHCLARCWKLTLTSHCSSADQTLVEISVDDCGTTEKQKFMLHRGLLYSCSPYFHETFNGEFRESDEKTIYLPGVTASTMRLFQHWVYGQVDRTEPERSPKKVKTWQKSAYRDRDEANEWIRTAERISTWRDYIPKELRSWVNTHGNLVLKTSYPANQ